MSSTKPNVHVQYRTRRAVLASCRTANGALTLFVPTGDPIHAGTPIRLAITFGDSEQIFELEGVVTWRRAQSRGLGLEPGLGVEFSPPEKFRAAQMLAFCAGRPLAAGTAAEKRVPAEVACHVRIGPRRLSGQIRDLSSSGAFVCGPAFTRLAQGTELCIELRRGWFGLGARQLKARVIWKGYKNGFFGFGARFIEDATRTRPILRRYLTKPG